MNFPMDAGESKEMPPGGDAAAACWSFPGNTGGHALRYALAGFVMLGFALGHLAWPWLAAPFGAAGAISLAWAGVRCEWIVDPGQRQIIRQRRWLGWRCGMRRWSASGYQWVRVCTPDASLMRLELGNRQYLTLTLATRLATGRNRPLTPAEFVRYQTELVALSRRIAASLGLVDRGFMAVT